MCVQLIPQSSLSPAPQWARDFVGRLMADPAFVQKLVIEQLLAATASLWYEFQARGDKFLDELDLVLINTLGLMAATGATTWIVAPTRSYGSLHKFPWQQTLSGLPNCVFDASGPLRTFSKGARIGGFAARMAELSAVGVLTGTATSAAGQAAVALRRRRDPAFEPSVAPASIGRSSGGLGAFFALNANVRYQLLGGLDRLLFERSNYLWAYVGATLVARAASSRIGELSRPWWQGLPDAQALAAQRAAAAPAATRSVRRVRRVKKASSAAAIAAPAAAASSSAAPEAAAVAGAVAVASASYAAEASPAAQAEASVSSSSADAAPAMASAGEGVDHSLPLVMVAPSGAQVQLSATQSQLSHSPAPVAAQS